MLTQLAPDMNCFKVQKAVSVLLAAEMLNQKQLYLDQNPGEFDKCKSDIEFRVSNGKYYTEDMSKFPLVNCWIGAGNPSSDDVGELEQTTKFYFDLYVFRKDERLDSNEIIDGENGADKRLNYMISQIWYILEAQQNFWKGDKSIISFMNYVGFLKEPSDKRPTQHPTYMTRLVFDLNTSEQKEILDGFDVDEFVAKIIANTKELPEFIINVTV